MRILALLIALAFPFQILSAQIAHEGYDSLLVVWGQKNHHGASDCSAWANITWTDSTLTIEVDVTDDNLVFSGDSLHSDHVEVWFAPRYRTYDDGPSNSVLSYIWDNKNSMFLYRDTADLRAFRREIRSPLIETSNYGPEYLAYDTLNLSNVEELFLKDEIDQYLHDVRQSTPTVKRIFYGVTHWGIFPENGRAVLYDRENYAVLEKMIGMEIPDLSRFVAVKTSTRTNGYTVSITFRPEAIGFSDRNGIEQLRYMIDVVDVDGGGRQETILSTSANRQWGQPSTFGEMNLYPSIAVKLDPDFAEAGNIMSWHYTQNLRPVDYISRDFLYTSGGWTPIERTADEFYLYDQPFGFRLAKIVKLSYQRATLHYRAEKRGKDSLEFLSTFTGDYLFVGRRIVCPIKDTLATFLLSDSSVALLMTTFESSGSFDRSHLSSLVFAAGSSETKLAELWNGSGLYHADSLVCDNKQWDLDRMNWIEMYDEKNFNWARVWTWGSYGRSIVIDAGNGIRLRFSWDDMGGNVTYSRL